MSTYRQVSALASSGGVSSLSVPKPTGTAENDVLVAFHWADSSTAGQMTASGWTERIVESGLGSVVFKLWIKIAGNSEPSNYTFGCGSGADTLVIIHAIQGADTSAPIDVVSGGGFAVATAFSGSNTAPQPAPSVSPLSGDALLICGAAAPLGSGTISSYTPPAGMTERGDVQCSVAFGGFLHGACASVTLSASGATGTKDFGPTTSTPYLTASVAIKSAGGGTDFLKVVTDGATATDLASPMKAFARVVSEESTASDTTQDTHIEVTDTITETATATDSLEVTVTAVRSLTETATATDAAAGSQGGGTNLVDGATGQDSTATELTADRVLVSSGAAFDTLTAALSVPRALVETATAHDAVTGVLFTPSDPTVDISVTVQPTRVRAHFTINTDRDSGTRFDVEQGRLPRRVGDGNRTGRTIEPSRTKRSQP